MEAIEVAFLDEYKRLDALCGDLFSCRQGISEYIVQMEQTPFYKQCRIPLWNEDLRTLKHLRKLRNSIVHDLHITGCEKGDIEQAVKFHNRILSQQDPLAALWRLKQPHDQKPLVQPHLVIEENIPVKHQLPRDLTPVFRASLLIVILIFALILALIFLIGKV